MTIAITPNAKEQIQTKVNELIARLRLERLDPTIYDRDLDFQIKIIGGVSALARNTELCKWCQSVQEFLKN
jgi:hypothetical protein